MLTARARAGGTGACLRSVVLSNQLLELLASHLIESAACLARLQRHLRCHDASALAAQAFALHQRFGLALAEGARVGEICDPPLEARVAEEVITAIERAEAVGRVDRLLKRHARADRALFIQALTALGQALVLRRGLSR